MNKRSRACMILIINLALCGFISMTIVREVHVADISLYVVGIPLYLVSAIGIFYYMVEMVSPKRTTYERFLSASVLCFFLGLTGSFFLFVIKYSSNALISYISAWMPAIFFLAASIILGVGALILAFLIPDKPVKPRRE